MRVRVGVGVGVRGGEGEGEGSEVRRGHEVTADGIPSSSMGSRCGARRRRGGMR